MKVKMVRSIKQKLLEGKTNPIHIEVLPIISHSNSMKALQIFLTFKATKYS